MSVINKQQFKESLELDRVKMQASLKDYDLSDEPACVNLLDCTFDMFQRMVDNQPDVDVKAKILKDLEDTANSYNLASGNNQAIRQGLLIAIDIVKECNLDS